MAALITPSELPRWVPGQVLCASDGLGWKGIALRSYRYTGLDVEVPGLSDYAIVSYRHGATRMERRFEGAWTRTRCVPGDVSLLTRSQASHWHWTEDIDVTHVYLSDGLLSKVASDVLERSIAEVRLQDLLRAHDPLLTSLVDALTDEARQPLLGGSLYVEALGAQLAVHLLRRYASVTYRDPLARGRLSPSQQRSVVDYIQSHLNDPLGLQELAEVAGLGIWTFGRRFRESFGCPPHAYVIDQRVARAQRLLADGSLALKQIASACGFADQSHMTRVLHARLGKTPAMLRRP